jgi:hypothetical protein
MGIKISLPITQIEREIFTAGYNSDDPTKQTETLCSLLGRTFGAMDDAGYKIKIADFDEGEIGILGTYFDGLQTQFENIVNYQKTDIIEPTDGDRSIKHNQRKPPTGKSRGDLDEVPATMPTPLPIILAQAFLMGGWPAVLAVVISHAVRMAAQQLIESTNNRLTEDESPESSAKLKEIAETLKAIHLSENVIRCPYTGCDIYSKSFQREST